MAIELFNKNGSINLSHPLVKGDDGGYYIPFVDAEGNLSWKPSEEGMEPADTANIIGPPGEKGECGVYVGATEPTEEDVLVWINTEGETSEGLATIEYVDNAIASVPGTDLTGYATEDYVDEQIGKIPTTEVPENVSSFTNDAGYQTEAQVSAAITAAIGKIVDGNEVAY